MRTTFKRQQAMFRRTHDLAVTIPDNTPAVIPIKELEAIIARLGAHGEAQELYHRRMRSLTTQLRERSRLLYQDQMRPIALAAPNVIPVGAQTREEVERSVQLPSRRADYESIILAARGLASAVESYKDGFVAAGLAPDFIERLRAGATSLEEAVNARSAVLQRRLAATEGIQHEVRRGRTVLKLLDALVTPLVRNDPARLAEWSKAMRIAKPPVFEEGAVEEPSPVLKAA